MSYHINLNKITWDATKALLKLDDSFVGTPNYLGITYFWDSEYKHYLRDASPQARIKIHNTLLKLGLKVWDVSDKHLEVIKKYYQDSHYKRKHGIEDAKKKERLINYISVDAGTGGIDFEP